MEKHPLHLKNPEFQTSREVQRAVERKQDRTGERVPNDPSERIEAYMDRLEKIFLNPDSRVRERNLEMFRDKIYDALIIKRENFPESYFELQKRIAHEQGHGDIEITDEMRERMTETAIADQKASLDSWIEYLTEEDVAYPPWFKFYVWAQVTKLSQFDKQLGKFKSRTESTVGRFPDINRAALAKILDLYENYPQIRREIETQVQPLRVKKNELRAKKKITADETEASKVDEEIRTIDQEISIISEPLVNFNKKFPDLYAEIIAKGLASTVENKEEIRGEWVKYPAKNSVAAEKLWRSVEGKTGAAGWCIEGKATAQSYNQAGDFHVYYTYDKEGNPSQPRLAIQMNNNQIGQIRGLLAHQDVEPIMQEVLDTKLAEFGSEADAYRKKSLDMRRITALERKHEKKEVFTKDDLLFLYEIESSIEGFGYERDPRIAELRRDRNLDKDMLVIFECRKDQIAHVPSEIRGDTKAYIGPLEPGIFDRLPEDLEHVYTSFPEKKICREDVEIGGKSASELQRELQALDNNISNYSKNMLKSQDFVVGKNRETITLVRLSMADLGFAKGATTDQIYKRVEELGLELCPPDTGPNYRLKYQNQPLNEWIYIGTKRITDSYGNPRMFTLVHDTVGLWLDSILVKPDYDWDPHRQFVFRLRKKNSKS